MNVSIRYKILALVGVLLAGAMISYVTLARDLFNKDRMAYVFDLSSTLSETLSEEVHLSLESLGDKLRYFGGELGASSQSTKHAAVQAAASRMLSADPDVLSLELWRRGPDGAMARTLHLADQERLGELNIEPADIAEARRLRPIPWDTVEAEGTVLMNTSLAPDLALLSVAVAQSDGTVVVADVRPERLLRVFGETEMFTAYLVDRHGAVVVHPDPTFVLNHTNLRQSELVRLAVEGTPRRAVKLVLSQQGDEIIGGFSRLHRDMGAVITEIPKSEALRAGAELVRKSTLFAIAVMLVGFLLAIFFARRLVAPILRLEKATGAIAKGDFSVNIDVHGGDEVGKLARAFASMARQLHDRDLRLNDAHEQIVQSEKLATIGELSAGISHEVKNPLAGMRGFAQLGKRVENMEGAMEYFGLIEDETQRAMDILDNLLKFARQDAPELKALQINDVVRDAVRLVSHQCQIHGVRIVLELDDDLPAVLGDGNQLRQVLVNFAINAQHAMENSSDRLLTLGTARENSRVHITVKDTGSGMTSDVKDSLFKPFFTTKVAGRGTGLGMSVSNRIIKSHRGTIFVDSEVGQGTTFELALPLADGAIL